MTDAAISELAPVVGVRVACEAVGAPQANWYRRHRQSPALQRPAPVPRSRRQDQPSCERTSGDAPLPRIPKSPPDDRLHFGICWLSNHVLWHPSQVPQRNQLQFT